MCICKTPQTRTSACYYFGCVLLFVACYYSEHLQKAHMASVSVSILMISSTTSSSNVRASSISSRAMTKTTTKNEQAHEALHSSTITITSIAQNHPSAPTFSLRKHCFLRQNFPKKNGACYNLGGENSSKHACYY